MYFVVYKHWNVKLLTLCVQGASIVFRPFVQKCRYHWYETGHQIIARLAQLAIVKLKLRDF